MASRDLGVGMEFPNEIDHAEKASSKLSEAYSPGDPQVSVNSHFELAASDWERLYRDLAVPGRIYQDRMVINHTMDRTTRSTETTSCITPDGREQLWKPGPDNH